MLFKHNPIPIRMFGPAGVVRSFRAPRYEHLTPSESVSMHTFGIDINPEGIERS